MKIKYLTLLLVVIFPLFNQLCFGQLNPKEKTAIDDFGKQLATDLIKDNLHGSISVAVVKGSSVIWSGAFGYARMKENVAADTNTIYRIGSITKTFTAALLMQLVQEGRVKLDDPIEKYLPEIKNLIGYDSTIKITFRQLASHTSGLSREPNMKGADAGPLNEWEQKTLTSINKTSFIDIPGARFSYSNIGFAILGVALSRVASVPYIQMVQDRIFNPLHMADSFFALPENKLSHLAEGISNDEHSVNTSKPLQELKGRGYKVPNGGIYSTPNDLARFAIAFTSNSKLLNSESLKQMQIIPPGGERYGLGLGVYNYEGIDLIGHDGSVPGYTSTMFIEKTSGYAVILMRNYNSGSTDLTGAAQQLLKALSK
ncbi:serine hydrolase domain-containing protein [Mucilaginibacter agri]|uniref:Serine hydrolase n=1 Tax=Mucilaginibacter agri TaxID=2695265 RepID=A0A965ZI02_9SPHI|nr:serine hydrolase domain-containing protein [Mucilaginibacter agri]NCD71449.1 serine hydrolase [Mucilaginibacter agri]